ncbi:chemotaxis protein CheY [Clostridium acetireducens DSM 10703]|uniref:Stage 0 sporulation protein A homolog n=1 Tax=Clostridium acetireducens DSM 10703 TaxID=1121290 RepID=A0A1E8F126_9CLOT|nr:response regulator [Clostridium acetireducens]OFI07022.1 chemotaxis protein CheY [Clostridium acetireducens DSM 10703]
MESVILLENMCYTRYVVKELLTSNNIKVYETANSIEFFNKLYEKKKEIKLIILEINLNEEDGLEVIKKIKERNIDIPIMILTSINKRDAFIKGVKAGAIDYILKPYEDNMLINRVIKCINSDNRRFISREKVYLNFQKYLNNEIKKAIQGKYNISIMMLSFIKFTKKQEKIELKDEYLILTEIVYKEIKELFKNPNVITKRGFSTFIGVFPHLDDNEILKAEDKIENVYNEMKNRDIRLKNYYLEKASVTLPKDGQERNELMDKLTFKLKNKIEDSGLKFNTII